MTAVTPIVDLHAGRSSAMADAQSQVQTLLEDLIARGQEDGLQVAAYLRGEFVVDAWAGVADTATGRPVNGETLFTVFSTTKGVAVTVIHLLVEQGRLDYDAPVARYWPAFAASGKARITVRQVLTHTAGIPQRPAIESPADLCDWAAMCRAVAGHAPIWEPGTRTGYHAASIGWIVGEVARRIDGRPIDRIVREDLCAPLGITNFYLGIPDAVEPRVATLVLDESQANLPPPEPGSPAALAMPPARRPEERTDRLWNRPDIRRAVLPHGGGITSARALARLYAGITTGVDGRRLLSDERVRIATTPHTGEVDQVVGREIRKGLGYFLGGPESPMGERITAFGHPGLGGSIAFADPEYGLAFALTKTRLVASPPGTGAALEVARTVRAALGIPEAG
jgi:CubicO group peptidase (beta-lactamase class C family)